MLETTRQEPRLDFERGSPEIGIVGAGIMGRGIAQVAALAGLPVRLYDVDAGKCEAATAFIGGMLERSVAKKTISQGEAEQALARLRSTPELGELRGVSLVIEAIVEDLAAKQSLMRALEDVVDANCVFATNTSSLMVTAIAAACSRPDRVAGLHFFNPVPMMKLVEVIPGQHTAAQLIPALCGFVRRLGHTPVVASDTPGFLVNHAGRGLYTEGLRIVSEGIAPPHEVDKLMREAAGFRMGPFELFDLTGLDVSYSVLQQIYRQFFEEPRFRPAPFLTRQHAAGLFGRKVGRGFYEYRDQAIVIPPDAAPERHEARPIWVNARESDDARQVRERLAALGLPLDNGAKPGPDSIIVIAPLGTDATTTATANGLDPERTVAIDPLFGLQSRWTLMTNVVTRPAIRDALHGMLLQAGAKVSVIRDSPGFVCQRVVATIINIACDIAQQRVASPMEIDVAVRLGLGYPQGPLALGDRIGANTVLTVLDRMAAFYGDPRYRASPWLRRRAELGVSLETMES